MTGRLNTVKLGLAAGILWGLSMFVMTWLAMWTGYAAMWLTIMIDLYPGYDIGPTGSVIGLIYGFVDGFISLFLLGWLYNRMNP